MYWAYVIFWYLEQFVVFAVIRTRVSFRFRLSGQRSMRAYRTTYTKLLRIPCNLSMPRRLPTTTSAPTWSNTPSSRRQQFFHHHLATTSSRKAISSRISRIVMYWPSEVNMQLVYTISSQSLALGVYLIFSVVSSSSWVQQGALVVEC